MHPAPLLRHGIRLALVAACAEPLLAGGGTDDRGRSRDEARAAFRADARPEQDFRTVGAREEAREDARRESGTSRSTAVHAFDFWQESEPTDFDTRTRDAVCADLDGDGLPELVRLGIAYGDPHGGTLGVTRGGEYGPQGPEFFQDLLPSPRSVRAVDLDLDGRLDLIAAHLRPVPGSPNLFVRAARLYLQTGAVGAGIRFLDPPPSVDLAPGGEQILIADVDLDGVADLVSVGTAHELYYQRGLGPAAGSPAVPLFSAEAVNVSQLAARTAGLPLGSTFSFGFANDLACGDFDGDDTTDLAVAAGSAFGGGVHVYYRRSGGWVYQGFFAGGGGQPGTTFSSLARGDFDGDGLDDLVATSPSRDLTTLLNGRSRAAAADPAGFLGMFAVTSPGVGLGGVHAVSADFDGDTRADVAFLAATSGTLYVHYHAGADAAPGAFSSLPAASGRFDLRGQLGCALDALDVDADGDVDLVGSYLSSQSTSVLSNERLANVRKPQSVLRLLGAPVSGPLADTFVPDGLAFLQRPTPSLAPELALDRFTFRAHAVPGEHLRLRARVHGLRAGVDVRLGLFDAAAGGLRWVHARTVGTAPESCVVVVPEAARFVSATGEVEVLVLSHAGGRDFGLAIDQLSAEVIP